MKDEWLKLTAKFNALGQRERVLVMAAIVVILVVVVNAILLDPVNRRVKELSGQLASDRTQLALAQQQLQVLENSPPVDPDAQNRLRLDTLNEQTHEVIRSLDDMQRELVSPDRMAGLLEDILKKNGQLKLVSLKTLPAGDSALSGAATPHSTLKASSPSSEGLSVYRHGVELIVQGNYLDLMNYMELLEKLPWHVLWGNMKLTTDAYPQSTLTLTIYTLSLDKAWLSI